MLDKRKVSVIMAAGRRRYLPIITKYILDCKDFIDEWQLWINTTVQEDIDYMLDFANQHKDFVRVVRCPTDHWGPVGSMGAIRAFYTKETIDPGTIYLRVDDDIVHVDKDAFRTLAQFRAMNRKYFLISANMMNSGLCSHLHHRLGCHQETTPPMDAPIWESSGGLLHWSSNMATVIHDSYLKDAIAGRLDKWKQFERWELYENPRFGIACCSFFGCDMLELLGKWEDEDDEIFMTGIWPNRVGKINCIAGKALVAHYAYGPQRENGFETRDDKVEINGAEIYSKHILNRYRKLAGVEAV